MKKIIKKILINVVGKSACEIDKIIKKNDLVISFDIFDTLVVRNCETPTDIFDLVQLKYNELYKKNPILNYKEERINAEKKARVTLKDEEITLSDIYSCFEKVKSNEVINKLREIEVEIEMTLCQANYEMKKVFEAAVNSGKQIILISDMYLPKEVINKILEKCGYYNFKKIYVSCEWKKTKLSGGIFTEVLNDLGIKEKQLLHIGDNLHADYYSPKKNKIKSLLYKKNIYKPVFFQKNKKCNFNEEENLQYNILKNVIRNNIEQINSQEETIGFEVMGPILLGFSQWLYNKLKESGFEKIHFLAREGKILKQAFDLLYSDLETFYIYVSRVAICRSVAINASNFDELYNIFLPIVKYITTVGDYLEILGIKKYSDKRLNEITLDMDTRLDEIVDKQTVFNYIMLIGKEYFCEQNELLKEYLEENKFKENVAVCDIGWSGSMQLMLQEYFLKNTVNGYYIGVSDMRKEELYLKGRRYGYWFEVKDKYFNSQKLRFSLSVMESLFLCGEGTTVEYKRKDGKAVPVLEKKENDIITIMKMDEIKKVSLKFIEILRKTEILKLFNGFSEKVVFQGYDNFAVYPKLKTTTFFEKIRFVDGVKVSKITPEHNLIYYFFHIKEFKREFENNISKTVWLKSLFKLKLPYLNFLIFLTNKVGLKSACRKKIQNKC